MSLLGKILLVEDDELDAEMATRALKELPLANEIIWLETGQELLDYLEENGTDEVAVVILDLNMPQINGIEALREIRKRKYPKIPIVVLTSSKENPDVQTCYDLGVNAFITKPVSLDQFQEAVRALGLFWTVLNVRPKPK